MSRFVLRAIIGLSLAYLGSACVKTEESNLRTPRGSSVGAPLKKAGTMTLSEWQGQSDLEPQGWTIEDLF